MDNQFRIIIVGGGIAGLSAAIALRGPNRSVTILERSRMLNEIGAMLSLQPNASKIATQLGLDEILATKGPKIDDLMKIYDQEGHLVKAVPSTLGETGAHRVVYHRADLHSALLEKATGVGHGEPARTRTSSRVVSCDCDRGMVRLESGEELDADLIIGADGIHSVLRKSVTGCDFPAITTGVSAYRLLLDTRDIEGSPKILAHLDPREEATHMVVGHDKRIVMGSGRNGDIFGLVALVPDEQMNEDSTSNSWTSTGSMEKLLESFADFPDWIKELFKLQKDSMSLWQLRDLDPLPTWIRGRTILIGDSSHAMLPTQGQGASQSLEDAEALGAFFEDVTSRPSFELVKTKLQQVFAVRYERASLIQNFSRLHARPGTQSGQNKAVTLDPSEFISYNCNYSGAKAWQAQQQARIEAVKA
ncbi:salicylate 1-monooxygenase [Teratosphaeria destructans]|uniref:Salicylate 1-monooxygenase n=1 Tax=Teratosphaeria destructans TaxID=418781 RepID=A0A9W7SZ44_9PEZI|nr:salicylate 1-monooxygenase [Teratosphaeria destructans]